MKNSARPFNFRKILKTKSWGKLLGNAALITLVVQAMFAYLSDKPLSITVPVEFLFTFFYFLSLLWIYPKISRLMHSASVKQLSSFLQNFFEAVIIVITTFSLNLIAKILPMWVLLLGINYFTESTWAFDIVAVRRSVIIHAILGLFLYYLFEREKIIRQIQIEHLRHENLLREEFKNELEGLKNQVNPEFLFGNLKLLETLIKEDKKKANEFVNRISFLYRSFLENKEQLIPLSKELKITEAYLDLLKFKYREELRVNNEIPESLPDYQIPQGTTKLLLDHIIQQKNKTELLITLGLEDETLSFSISGRENKFLINPESIEIKKIRKHYAYLSDRPAELFKTELGYTIKLPLLKVEQ